MKAEQSDRLLLTIIDGYAGFVHGKVAAAVGLQGEIVYAKFLKIAAT